MAPVRGGRVVQCFIHQDQPAVGVCRTCGRGLCPACTSEVEGGLACAGRCEGDVIALARLLAAEQTNLAQAQKLTAAGRTSIVGVGWFLIVAGAVLMGWELVTDSGLWFVTAIGAVFALFGALALAGSRRWPQLATPQADPGSAETSPPPVTISPTDRPPLRGYSLFLIIAGALLAASTMPALELELSVKLAWMLLPVVGTALVTMGVLGWIGLMRWPHLQGNERPPRGTPDG
jgi:hypothetical protein